MVRICIDARPGVVARGTGIGNYTYQLVHCLARQNTRHEYYLLWPDDGTSPWQLPSNFSFHPMTRKRREEMIYLPKWLENHGIVLYHAPDNGLHAFPCEQVQLVVTIHDLIPFVMPETVRRGYRRNFLEKVPEIADRAQAVITVSQRAKQDIRSILNMPEQKVQVIYPAQEQIFSEKTTNRANAYLHRRYGVSAPFVLYSGGLNPRKNVRELIYSFAKARQYFHRDRLLVIPGGISEEAQRLLELCRALSVENKVIFPGFVSLDDLAAFYQVAELFVYPSLYEGFGLPPLEAMASGTPVVSSPVPSVVELASQACLIFNPEDTTALVDHLHRGLADQTLRDTIRQKGSAVAAGLNWDNTAKQTLEVYHKLLGIPLAGENN
ncbi:MAG: glycosyltransferase family 4 protein [Firmicutes bacterium]|nr:glycosyltransferase family 4 protein [Bacillota bacterium]